MNNQKDIKDKIEELVSCLSTDEAIFKLNGYFRQYYWNNYLRTSLGRLYLTKGDFVNAGKWLYFQNNPTESEKRAIARFVESCKNRKLTIFNALVINSKIPEGISLEMSEQLFTLIISIAEEEGALPLNIVRWIYRYNRVRNIEIEKGIIGDQYKK